MFATLFVGILDVQSGQLRYINAGHDLPYLLRRDSKFTNLSSTGPLVGAFIYASFTTQIVQIEPGEILVLYSDGITDAHNPAGEMYTQDRWERMLIQPVPSSQNQIEHLTNQVLEFIGEAPQFDDITLVSIRRLDE
jgi:sigma-B regulation protein RsbU (phosphoserine phosphatase)